MKRLVIVRVTLFLAALSFVLHFGSVEAHGKSTPGTLPLYEDSLTGWKVWKGFDGPGRVERYEFYLDKIRAFGQEPPAGMVNQNEKYMSEHIPAYWYVFSLVIPDNVLTFWNAKSELTLRYVSGKDTLVATSNTIFFSDATRRRLIFTYDLPGDFAVPNAQGLYAEKAPLVYARFDFKKAPDYLLSCTPSRVRSTFEEVSRR